MISINNSKDKHVKIDTILLTKLLGICLDVWWRFRYAIISEITVILSLLRPNLQLNIHHYS